MKVLFISNIPSPYMTSFFNELGKHVDLTVMFERKKAKNRDISWTKYQFQNFKGIFMKSIPVGIENGISLKLVGVGFSKYDIVIFGNFTSVTGIFGIMKMKLFRKKYYLFSEGGIPKNKRSIKEIIKKVVIKGAHRYLSSCDIGDLYFLKYGAKKENIRRIPFTTLYNSDLIDIDNYSKKDLRRLINLPEDKRIILSIGMFNANKNFETVIEAMKHLDNSYYLVLIGGGPNESSYLKLVDHSLNNVKILGFMEKSKIINYYRASDLFVLPTLSDTWGLVIVEAISQGLPVITTTNCVAGIELIKNGINGYLFEPKNTFELVDYIGKVFSNGFDMNESRRLNEMIRKYQTFESMVTEHLRIFKEDVNEGS